MNRLIQWFVDNPVASNLLMIMIAIGGFISFQSLNREVFPPAQTNMIVVQVPYPSAGPVEIEELIIKRVEEAVADLDGIKQINAQAKRNLGTVTIEAINGYDPQRLLNSVKARVDAISTFPVDAESPIIMEQPFQTQIMSIGLYGDVSEKALKQLGENLRDEISLLPGVSIVDLNATRPEEISVEVSEQSLRRYGLRFDDIATAIASHSLNLPAGTIQSDSGDIQLQTRSQSYHAEDFERIPVLSTEDGAKLKVEDVATVIDGFADEHLIAHLNGKRAVFLEVKTTQKVNVVEVASTVRDYIERTAPTLPEGVALTVWRDWSVLFEGRLNLLLKNASSGLLLVFIILMLFLRPALAMWVCVGISISFLGAIWLLPLASISLNMISLFAFLLVLGIVVDDAIIVGESIYAKQQAGLQGSCAASSGAKAVATPVFFAVVSTMIFFVPMLFVPGTMGDISYPIPVVIMLCLVFSLIEATLILPSHLAKLRPEKPATNPLAALLNNTRQKLATGLQYFAINQYQPFLQKALRHSGTTVTIFFVAFGVSVAIFAGGWIQKNFMPVVTSDFIRLEVTVPEGSPFHIQENILTKMEAAAETLKTDPIFNGDHRDLIQNIQGWAWSNKALMTLALANGNHQNTSADAILQRWKALVGPLPEAQTLKDSATINEISDPISLRLTLNSRSETQLLEATEDVAQSLGQYPGIFEVRDSYTAARTEIELRLKPHAETLGLTLADIAQQVRQGFYGEEVQRVPRGREDVKVMVRYPKAERDDLYQLSDMRIRTLDGREIPLNTVAEVAFVPGYTTIDRVNRKRAITITAQVHSGEADPNIVVQDIMSRKLPQWQQQYSGFKLTVSGDMEEEALFLDSAVRNFTLTMLAIYALMAVAFRSYWQPILILTAIPFGFMGAIIGHLVMGREVSMMSMMGFFACAGVVVNDNLVLLDRINQLVAQGKTALAAVTQAGTDRFRAILLTSVTTFIGLAPIMWETSTQARFLIPMVIALSFGVLCATAITLLLMPCLYLIGSQIKDRLKTHTNTA